jgi:hypothetical protein
VALPPTVPGPPNAVVQVQPGMNVQAVCIVTPPTGAVLTTTGAPANTSVAVQPGTAVKAIVLVNSAGQLVSY